MRLPGAGRRRCRAAAPALALLLAAAVAAGAPPPFATCASDPRLCPEATGLAHAHAPLAWSRTAMSGGGAVLDFDGDGDQDLFVVTGGGAPDRLYRNDGGGVFTDVAAAAGVARAHRGQGAAAADVDGDGDADLFVASHGPAGAPRPGFHLLYRNDGPAGADGMVRFTEIGRRAGVATTTTGIESGMGGSFGDYDLDGDLDLFVASWSGETAGNTLFRNDGVVDGVPRFTDVTRAAGLAAAGVRAFTPILADATGDRYPELLLAADFGMSRYYVNRGDGTFAERTEAAGAGLDENGMGAAAGDFDGDGTLDWYVTSIHTAHPPPRSGGTGNKLYLNRGDGTFREIAADAKVKRGGWGWGAVAIDHDLDGRLDIAATGGWNEANGAGVAEWIEQRSVLFGNMERRLDPALPRFADRTGPAGFAHRGQGRGMVHLDYDDDGDQDVVIFNNQGRPALLRNDAIHPGRPPAGGWLRVFLDTTGDAAAAPDGFGARVVVTTGGVEQVRAMFGGAGYLTSSERSAHFGLGAGHAAGNAADLAAGAPVDELRVEWPDGLVSRFASVPSGVTYTVRRTAGRVTIRARTRSLTTAGNRGPGASGRPRRSTAG